MKRCLPLLLTVLLLWGCAAEPLPETTLPEPVGTKVTEAATSSGSLYDPESNLEKHTNGALQVYPLNRSDAAAILRMGNDLLLFSGEKATTLTKISGDGWHISAVANLDCLILAQDPAVKVSEKGVTYYDEATRELVFLDANLKEGTRFPMPGDMVGTPALSANRKNLYYHTGNMLRTIDLDSGLNVLIREMGHTVDNIEALHCYDSVIACRITDSYGTPSTLFLSVKTGETLWETQNQLTLTTNGSRYFARHLDGIYPEYLVGTAGEPEQLLRYNGFTTTAHPVLEAGGIVIRSTGDQETTILDFCNPETGRRTAQLELPGLMEPISVIANAQGTGIWFLTFDEGYGSHILCHWEPARSTIVDDRTYLTNRFTLQNPDSDGLSSCQTLAEKIAAKHGISLLLGTDAAMEPAVAPETEYQTWTIHNALEALEEMLSIYPTGFLNQLSSPSGAPLRICLVRNFDFQDVDEDLRCLVYRDANADPWLYLALEADWEADFQHQLFHLIESYVIISCPTFDSWNSLNPKSFRYTLRHLEEPTDAIQPFLESGAFINLYATSFPKEDRAVTFITALEPGNEDLFQTKVMQSKLKLLSTGIRRAFGYRKSNITFLWEQYLK